KRLLNTVRENLDDTGNVRKWTFGEKNQSKTRTIMMMGETGTGKSTLINVMVNYILGVEKMDEFYSLSDSLTPLAMGTRKEKIMTNS
ncbi:hypothetical protein JZ751_030051, partial [Albula glossodonta]